MAIPLEQAVALAGLAGEIMLENGAETCRVEETIEHIGRALGAAKVESFVVPTGVFLTATDAEGKSMTTMRRVRGRTINLDRIAKVNELSRRLVDQRIDDKDAKVIMERISRERTGFSLMPSMLASGMIGGTTAVLQEGALLEIVFAFLAAWAVRYIAHVISRLHGVQFTFEFLGGMTVALIGVLFHSIWPYLSRDVVIIGGIMPLVPGVAITNSIRDFIAGDLVAGISRGTEAILTAGSVAMGVVIVLAMNGRSW